MAVTLAVTNYYEYIVVLVLNPSSANKLRKGQKLCFCRVREFDISNTEEETLKSYQ